MLDDAVSLLLAKLVKCRVSEGRGENATMDMDATIRNDERCSVLSADVLWVVKSLEGGAAAPPLVESDEEG